LSSTAGTIRIREHRRSRNGGADVDENRCEHLDDQGLCVPRGDGRLRTRNQPKPRRGCASPSRRGCRPGRRRRRRGCRRDRRSSRRDRRRGRSRRRPGRRGRAIRRELRIGTCRAPRRSPRQPPQ
jgi:hypothetical protein